MKKVFLFILPWFFVYFIFGQGVIYQPKMNILYRGIENHLELGSRVNYQTLDIFNSNGQLIKRNDSLFFIPEISRESTIVIKDNVTDTVLFKQYFRIQNLPPPILSFGGLTGGVIPNNANLIELEKEDYVFFPITYTIKNWTIYCENDSISGDGSTVDARINSLIEHQKPITIVVNYETNRNTKGSVSTLFLPNLTIKQPQLFDGEYIILDKEDYDDELFNENNLLSFINFIKQNPIVSPWFLHPSVLDRIEQSRNAKLVDYYRGNSNHLPLKGENGLDSINNNGHVVTAPHQKWGIDLTDISKIILFIEKENRSKKITKIGFAKQYSGAEKHDATCVLDIQTIFDSYPKYMYSSAIRNSILTNPNRLQELRDYQFERYSSLNYYDAKFETNSCIHFVENRIPFKNNKHEVSLNLRYTHNAFPFKTSWNQQQVNNFVDSSFMLFNTSDIPLVNLLGEDSVDVSGKYVYPVYDKFIYWKDVSTLIPFIEWELNNKNNLVVNRIIYCVEKNNSFTPIFYFNIQKGREQIKENSELYAYLIEIESKYNKEIDEFGWESLFQKVLEEKEALSSRKRKHRKRLDKTFNLDENNGKVLNLLGVAL